MATVKNFGLTGVSSDVQWGKSGGRFRFDGTDFGVFTSDGTTPAQLDVPLTPTQDEHAASKQYVDSVATGLVIRPAVRAKTVSVSELETSFTYDNVVDDNSSLSPSVWKAGSVVTPVFDGVTLSDGDRVLIDLASDARGNGLFFFVLNDVDNSNNSSFKRATDADNTPGAEVGGGVFAFVLEGTIAGGCGHVITSPQGTAVLGTDNIVWTEFTGASNISGGDGINVAGNIVSVDLAGGSALGFSTGQLDILGGTTGQALLSNGAASAAFGSLDISNGGNVSGNLSVSNGGTGLGNVLDRSVLRTTGDDTFLPLTVTPNSQDQILLWNDGLDDFEFVNADTIGSAYSTITADVGGSVTATGSETLNLQGGANGGIETTAVAGPTDAINLALDVNDLSAIGTAVEGADELAIFDNGAGATGKVTVTNFLNDLNVVNLGTFGSAHLISRSADDTYQEVTLAPSTVAGDEGISVVNGDGSTAGTIDIGLDIAGLVSQTSVLGTDEIVVFNGTNNVKTTVAQLVSGGTVAWTSISDGSTIINADTSSDTLTFNGTNGIVITVTDDPETVNVEVEINGLAGTTAVTGTSVFLVDAGDSGTNTKRSADNIMDDLDIFHGGTGNGFGARTGTDVYETRTFVADADAGFEGISVQNGDGVAGDPQIGLDITNLVEETNPVGTNELVLFNGTNNVKTTVTNLLAGVSANSISEGDSSVTVTDVGTGNVTIAVDANTVGTWDAGGLTMGTGTNIVNVAGTETAPSYTFDGSEDTGLYLDGNQNVCITDNGTNVACFDAPASAVNELLFSASATGNAVNVQAVGTDTDINLQLTPKGNGEVVLGSTGNAVINTDAGDTLTISTGDNVSGASGNIILQPGDGSTTDGEVCINDAGSNNITCFEGVALAVNNFQMVNAVTGSGPQLQAEGSDTSVDIRFLPKGTGVLSVEGTTNYEDNVLADDDIPNRKFVIDQITSGAAASGSHQSFFSTVDNTGALATTINIPANADIVRVVVNVTTAYLGSTGFDLGTVANSIRVAADSTGPVDWQTVGTYIVEHFEDFTGAASDFALGIQGGASATGVATIRVEYVNA